MTELLNNENKYIDIIEIDDFEDYGITEDGDIYSFWFNKMTKLKPLLTNAGYLLVILCKNKKKYQKLVHRLLAQTFIENPNNLSDVDHINHNRTDNRLQNLRWVSRRDNNRNRSLSKYSQTGIQGVGYEKSKNRWFAHWCNNDGKKCRKNFSAKKYVRARAMAIRWREQMVRDLYNRPPTP